MNVLDGRTALVTGSTHGIGAALAEGFAAHGATVWVHGRDRRAGTELAERIGGRFVYADLSQPADVEELATTLLAHGAALDVLVHNAGVETVMPVRRLDMSEVDRIWHINVRAPIMLTHRLLPLLEASGRAAIINLTSIHDVVPYPHNSVYCMSKAALAMFGRTAAIELAPLGIRVNNLAPGAVETEINRDVIREIGAENFRSWIPLGRVAAPAEMLAPALFLASDASSYMTGETLYVDGGYRSNLVRYRPVR